MEPTCRDIEEAIQEAWDRGAPAPLEGAIGAHCRTCPTCRVWLTRAAGWSAVLAGLRPVPATRDLSEALLAAWVLERDRPRATWRPRLALAASALVAAGLALWGGLRAREGGGGQIAEAHPPGRAELAQSLRDATSATLDLARLTSEPAARVGIKFLAAATRPIAPDLPGPASLSPSGRSLGVGEQVERGIKPISGSVRKAFEFLLPSADASDDPSPRRT